MGMKGGETSAPQVSHDPYERWKRLNTYFDAFLYEHCVDEESKRKIDHFRYQYLLKVANILRDEAILFQRDLSPWESLRINYHRCYQSSNTLLRAIEAEVGRRSGRNSDQLILLNQRTFTPLLRNKSFSREMRREDLLLFVNRSGFTPSLQNASAMAASYALCIENDSFLFPKMQGNLQSIEELIADPLFKAFRGHCFSSGVIADLLEGFLTVRIETSFKKECYSLLLDSYGRILHFIEEAVKVSLSCYFNLPKYENYMELILEEMLFWLIMARPYQTGVLEKLLYKAPFCRIVETGMGAFSEIISTVAKPGMTILAFDDCYYECLYHLEQVDCHLVKGPDYDSSLDELLKKTDKIDLLLVDFHNNITPGKFQTDRHDVKEIFSKVLPHASDDIVLLIDNTIGYLDSEEIADLLEAFPDKNIIVFTSHQKFDLFGSDKVSAGSYAVYSSDQALLNRFRSIQGGEIDWVSRQLLTHFFLFGRSKLEERRRRIFANGWYANQRLGDAIPGLVKKNDPLSFSVDLHLKEASLKEADILRQFRERGVPLMSRFSFGYNVSSQAIVREDLMRFSLGVEDQEFIDLFLNSFIEICKLL